MKLFTIVLTNRPDELTVRLHNALNDTEYVLHNRQNVKVTVHLESSIVEVCGILPQFRLTDEVHRLYAEAADAMARMIIEEEEHALLRGLIKREFHYEEEEEIDYIMEYCRAMLDGSGEAEAALEGRGRRMAKIRTEMTEYLQENIELNWEGFMRFRLKPYIEELLDIAEFAVDEYMMDRQYQEFISLLKYFVYIQEAKVPFVHLLHKGGNEFTLLDQQMKPMDTDHMETQVTVEMLEKDVNFEDMIVSTLISVSPRQIYIHTREPELQVIKTICQIFEDRVELCGVCRICSHNLDRTQFAEYNKR